MKKLLLLSFIIFTSASGFAQITLSQAAIKQYEAINQNTVIDGNDLTVYNLLEKFYTEALASDAGELKPETIDEVNRVADSKTIPNTNLLEIVLIYQNQLRLMAEKGEKPNMGFQILTTDMLVKESTKIYGKVPTVISIYQGETFFVGNMNDKALAVFRDILVKVPDCIPAKIYIWVLTDNEAEKQQLSDELKKKRPNHWMVKQYLK